MSEAPAENTSGGGFTAAVPAEIDRWNWGAFLFNWIWGLGNNTYIALLTLVPFAGIVMPFVLGAKGSAWAWRNKRWNSIAHFKEAQHQWALWGVIVWVVCIGFLTFIITLVSGVFVTLKHSEAYTLARTAAATSPLVIQHIGKPLTAGFPMGSISESGSSGDADLSFSVHGPKGHGEIYVTARMEMGEWKITRMVFEDGATGQRLELHVHQAGPPSHPPRGHPLSPLHTT